MSSLSDLKHKIESTSEKITFEFLREFIEEIDIDDLEYENEIPNPEAQGDYGRNILTLDPFECVLINWPPGVESAVHHHDGLFGYVWVLEGQLDNVLYKLEEGQLKECSIDRYGRKGFIPEPDGVIHKLRNNSGQNRAVTLHFYYPAIQSFEGMEIFNLKTGALGILSDNATTASWQKKEGHFKVVRKDAFKFVSYDELNKNKSHLINYVMPKPSANEINDMNAAYFSEQSEKYDFSDFNQPGRKSYIDSIDHLVADGIRMKKKVNKHLDVATGTGRRALRIRELVGKNYEIVGVDISESMCAIANDRGIRTYHQDWSKYEAEVDEKFDVISFLYAFGHIGDVVSRKRALKNICEHLEDDGILFFDVFSLKNENEWGGLVEKAFEKKNLGQFGYQKGDVFYRKQGYQEYAFLHYFTVDELRILLAECGMEIIDLHYVGYAQNPGEMTSSEKEGNIFIAAQKKK